MTANTNLEIQDIIEEILLKHRIDMFGYHSYDLRLRMPRYLILEKPHNLVEHYYEKNGNLILFVKKLDRYMRIGLYYEDNGDHKSDPVLTVDTNNRRWVPIRVERVHGTTEYSYTENRKRMIYQDKIEEFMSFQCTFAQYIRAQRWLEKGIMLRK